MLLVELIHKSKLILEEESVSKSQLLQFRRLFTTQLSMKSRHNLTDLNYNRRNAIENLATIQTIAFRESKVRAFGVRWRTLDTVIHNGI